MSNPDVWLVAPQDLHTVWPSVSAIFEEHKGLKETFTIGEMMVHLLNGNRQLWVGVDAGQVEGIMVTVIIRYVQGAKMHIEGIAGEHQLRKYLAIGLAKAEQYACIMDADELVFDGRPGWKRIMSKMGYRQTLQMRKNVRQLLAN